MAWTNAGYPSEVTDALRLTKARLFKTELMNAIQADVGDSGKSRSSASLNTLLAEVNRDIATYEARTGDDGSGPAVLVADLSQR